MSDETSPADDLIHIRLMNEYGGGLPLWPEDIDEDVDDLRLGDDLRAELMAFADRWDRSIPPEVYDDRWDGVPGMQQLVAAKYRADRLLHPARGRAAAQEDEDMRRIGEALAIRVQDELGPRYRVTYVHG